MKPRTRHRRPASRRMLLIGLAVLAVIVAGLGWLVLRPAPASPPTPLAAVRPSPTVILTARPSVRPHPSATTHPPSARPGTTPKPAKGQRSFAFVNHTTQTIWLAGWQQTAKPALTTTGWVLPAGHTLRVPVPDRWNGRFWGRTGCVFDAHGTGHCQTGDCGGKFQCRGYGGIPATLAEYNLNAYDNLDFYDVSMVDGSNLPMYINITKGATKDKVSASGCVSAGCTKPVDCPAALRVTSGGRVVGCISACARLNTDQYCCRGTWAPRPMCDPAKWPIDYAAVFKKAEPYAYSYSDDDATSTFTCKTDCDYQITFGLSP